LALDGTSGSLVVDPAFERFSAASAEMNARRRTEERHSRDRDLPAVTSDGRRVTVLANVASLAELQTALRAGAEGIGLLRTELAFLHAGDWPTEGDHRDAIEPILGAVGDRPVVVRVLDFGADKSPPFLPETPLRGIELLLANRDAFRRQLRAILDCARERDVRILLPLVEQPAQLAATRELIAEAAATVGSSTPPLGAMLETPAAVDAAPAIAAGVDFLSIGTNDLTASTLGTDRFASSGGCAHDPRVLRLIARCVAAAHDAGLRIEVCGEAASDPMMLTLLLGLGVDELSVGAARVGEVRAWVRRLGHGRATHLAATALEMHSADQVEAAVRPLAGELRSPSRQGRDRRRERVDRGTRVRARGS
jgi:phosphoenolpyruvate-protein kinase (PTS system EI component)